MDHLEFLFAGFAVFWAGLFVYLLLLQARLRSLSSEIKRLEERLAESADAGAEAGAALAAAERPGGTRGALAPGGGPTAPGGRGG